MIRALHSLAVALGHLSLWIEACSLALAKRAAIAHELELEQMGDAQPAAIPTYYAPGAPRP